MLKLECNSRCYDFINCLNKKYKINTLCIKYVLYFVSPIGWPLDVIHDISF